MDSSSNTTDFNSSLELVNELLARSHEILLTAVGLVYLITGLIYMIGWPTHSIAGRAFTHAVFCRAFHLSMLGISTFGFIKKWPSKSPSLCIAAGWLHQFFWMAEYSWLLIVNWDFWQRFRDLTPRRTNSSKNMTRKYIKYSLMAWGLPAVIATTSLILKKIFPQGSGIYFVDYASCTVTRSSTIIFLIPVIMVLIVISMWFTFNTRRALQRHRKETEMVRMAIITKKTLKQRPNPKISSSYSRSALFWKLSILMGVNWQIELFLSICLYMIFDSQRGIRDNTGGQYTRLRNLLGMLVLIVFMLVSAIFSAVMFIRKNKALRDELKMKVDKLLKKVLPFQQ